MTPFYDILKHNREELGLTVEQISDRTKISQDIINAIEAGDVQVLPKTYLRLFIRAYAQEINLDPAEILQNLEELLGEPETPIVAQPALNQNLPIAEVVEKIASNPSYTKHNRNFITIVIILVLIIFMISILRQVMIDEKKKDISAAFPVINTTDTTQIAVANPDTQTVVPKNELKLTILTKDTCWVRIIVDNRETFEDILPPRYKKEAIASEQFDVRVGRPATVNLILNGKDLGSVGAPAIPTRLIITKDGIIRRQSFSTR